MTYLARDYASWTNIRNQHPQTHGTVQANQPTTNTQYLITFELKTTMPGPYSIALPTWRVLTIADQTDQIGDGFGQHKSAKGPQKAQQDQEDYETRKEHSNSGSNTHKGTGMDYVDRKNAHGGNDVQRRREDGNQPTGQHGSVS
jgi:hypothetical protein